MSEPTVVLFTGGDRVDPAIAARLPREATVIAADSGIEHAIALGFGVDHAVGDFDSVSAEALVAAQAGGATTDLHPTAKDETDLELGLVAAAERGATRVVVVGGHGGRVDHFIANALLLGSPRFAAMSIEAHVGAARITVVRGRAEIDGPVGDLVSLLAVGGPALGVSTEGLRYPLRGERLDPGSTRGVSNELLATRGVVELRDGCLLAIQPGGQC